MASSNNVQELMARIFDLAQEGLKEDVSAEEYEQQKHDFVFHMTDWRSDLGELTALFNNPMGADDEVACTQVIGFLYHVIPHLNAAGRLLLGEVRDPFLKMTKPRKPRRKASVPKTI